MNSINETSTGVQQDQPGKINHNNTETIADSAAKHNGVTTNGFKDGKLIPAKELKPLISFQALLEADKHKIQVSGTYVKCRCPFHADNTPSFVVYDDMYGKCYGCSWYGDIYKYEIDFNQVDFRTAWYRLNDFFYKCPRAGRKARNVTNKVKLDEPQFTPRQLEERKRYSARLVDESWLADEVCQRRFEATGEKWKPETIRQLAKDGFLGWAGGALAFIYPRGTKYRDWPGRDFIWECDGSSLWRGELLAGAQHVYLNESETDTIAMLDAGIEHNEKGAAIIAISGAGGFQAEWAEAFTGKVVTLCFDNDDAGIAGANKTGLLLKPYVSELRILDLGGAK